MSVFGDLALGIAMFIFFVIIMLIAIQKARAKLKQPRIKRSKPKTEDWEEY